MDYKKVNQSRRSINFFDTEKKVGVELLKEIINDAVLAPSAFNLQPWSIIAVKSDEGKKKLHEACQQPKILEAPITLVLIGNPLGYRRDNPMWDIKKENGMEEAKIIGMIDFCESSLYFNEVKKNAMAVRNTSLFAMNIMISAENLGVHTHPMIGFNEDKVKEIFSIEKEKTVVMLISMGFLKKGQELNPREIRRTYDEIVIEA
ncbi:MAG: nitroreductase family protein [Bacteroidaceae bacterium]